MGGQAPPAASWGRVDPEWDGIRDVTLEVRGEPVHALRHEGHRAGPLQLLVHGLGGSAHNWLDVMARLAGHGEVLAVDLPGFGATPLPARGSARARANAAFVQALVEDVARDRVVLYGQSMGGLLATLAAAHHPAPLAGLVLVNPALPGARRVLWKQPARVFSRIIPAAMPGLGRLFVEYGFRRHTAERLIEESLATSLGPEGQVRDSLRQALVDNVREARRLPWRRRALAEAARSLVALHLEGASVYDAVDAVAVPTLLLWGDADRLVAGHAIAALVERRPDWEQHIFGDVGHAPMLEVPELFADVVSRWHQEFVAAGARA